ncbi:MAG: poly-gamma-glutamate system protein [Gammaproteobacteria bacterium]|jgi:poly-gamma-glutamate system protein|nr:poly-gamma-glutamate system protein [Gammaproteobacteria bacterium]
MAYTKVYWRPSQVPTGALIVLALIATAGLLMVETMRRQDTQADYGKMVAAARQMQECMTRIRELRVQIRQIDTDVDPADSGMIGVSSSPVTSLSGHLPAKQTTINPNWAAVAMKMLREAKVEKGDVVAVAVSGSFPALNIAAYTAIEQLGAEPLIIASGSASQWGANVPGLTWIDMARELRDSGLIESKEIAASLGGAEDRGIGVSQRGRDSIRQSIQRAKVPFLLPATLEEGVAKRIALYAEYSGGRPIKAYVNIGGGSASTGPAAIDQFFEPGLITSARPRAFAVDSVTGHFLKQDVPVLNFSGIATIARRYGLPLEPQVEQPIGSGGVYNTLSYRRELAALWILLILVLMYVVTRISGVVSAFGSKGEDPRRIRPTI